MRRIFKLSKGACILAGILLLDVMLVVEVSARTVQRGVVKEYQERNAKTPLGGVELGIRHAQPTVSDESGNFSLEFLTLNPGEKVNVRRIEKNGYEIFNKEALEQWNINPEEPFVIVMCRSDRFRQIRDNYERIASQNYRLQYDREINELERLKTEGALREEEYISRLRTLQENYERELDNLENYVDRFARIDLSELQPAEQEIIELVQQGRIDDAIARYEELNLVEKVLQETSDIREITEAVDNLTDIRAAKTQSRDSLLVTVENYINTLRLAGGGINNEKILNTYRRIADADTTNITWLLKTGNFIAYEIVDYDPALRYYRTALNSAISQYGENHPDVASIYLRIGDAYFCKSDYLASFDYMKRTLVIRQRISRENHPIEADSAADVFASMEFLMHIQNICIASGKSPMEFFDRIRSLQNGNFEVAYVRQSDYPKSAVSFKSAWRALRRIFSGNQPRTAASFNRRGIVSELQGDYPAALENYRTALGLLRDSVSQNHYEIAVSYNGIGRVFEKQGDYHGALENYERALNIRREVFGVNHRDVATSHNNIGVLYATQGNYQLALENFERALNIRRGLFGENNKDVATSHINIGVLYAAQGDYQHALENFERALNIRKEIFGENHSDVALCYNNIGSIYDRSGNYPAALENYGNALRIFSTIFGEEHEYVRTVRTKIADIEARMAANTEPAAETVR